MTYTTIYSVPKEGEIKNEAELGNSHGSAPVIWGMLCEEWLGDKHYHVTQTSCPKLWALSDDERLPMYQRIALATTYDKVVVRLENLPKVIWAMRKFHEEFMKRRPDSWTHLLEQADILQRIFDEGTAYGVCWTQTSVCADSWYAYDTCECCGQNLEEQRMFDLSKDDNYGAWLLFNIPGLKDFELEGEK